MPLQSIQTMPEGPHYISFICLLWEQIFFSGTARLKAIILSIQQSCTVLYDT